MSKKTIILFDVDGTLTVPRNKIEPEMIETLKELRKHYTIGTVGGSDLSKQKEQLGETVLDDFDYVFSENGLLAFDHGKEIHRQNIVSHFGEAHIRKFVKRTLTLLAEVDIPVQRGTFIELRNGMFNVSPIGRNCTQTERDAFEVYDKEHKVREKMIATLSKDFEDYNLKFSIGGQISFDVFPAGWDKTYCLQFVEKTHDKLVFFGDKTYEGGNDYEIYTSEKTVGHSVKTWKDTVQILREKYLSDIED